MLPLPYRSGYSKAVRQHLSRLFFFVCVPPSPPPLPKCLHQPLHDDEECCYTVLHEVVTNQPREKNILLRSLCVKYNMNSTFHSTNQTIISSTEYFCNINNIYLVVSNKQ